MRYIVIILLCCLACDAPPPERQPIPIAEDSTFLTGTFYLVRHAESGAGEDSALTEAGHHRAGALYRLLQDSGIQKVYFTHYQRSIQTADSICQYLAIDTASYKPDSTGEDLLYEITRHNDWGKKLLVIGQSNTLVPIMHSLKAKPKIDSIERKDYSSLYVVKKYRDSVKCWKTSYE
ncbi:histidine phosphatase family protein [Chitinophaga filiformis]|uniref:Histidine phosphatase superfamily (Branch 1) n=1 Tax=Chitinophaga filiformis TaxID=104663 RepID=A0A1G7QNI2_CHIFI|nr:phosphoglycerate mutase family protein [Chitinophaga filiformis]SDG00076.1 Histidine phosphatase superfamily (branch 1) [Chitinophaga filiformis]